LAPRVSTHVGSVLALVPAIMTTNTRSLPTAGAVNCRINCPAVYAVEIANFATA
jgi:hypothetical protein